MALCCHFFIFSLPLLPERRKILSYWAVMVPIALNPSRLRLAVAGIGPAADRRVALLRAAGAAPLRISTSGISAGTAAVPPLDILWIADVAPSEAARLAETARQQGVLVNVEDQPALSDFHNTAELRRGDLLITVSTGGQSPGLAGAIRDRIAAMFGGEWGGRLKEIGARRRRWRAEGRALDELRRLSAEALAQSGWLR